MIRLDVWLWPVAGTKAARLGGRLLGSTCRRGDAADRRWLRQPDAGQQLASLASAIEASSDAAELRARRQILTHLGPRRADQTGGDANSGPNTTYCEGRLQMKGS